MIKFKIKRKLLTILRKTVRFKKICFLEFLNPLKLRKMSFVEKSDQKKIGRGNVIIPMTDLNAGKVTPVGSSIAVKKTKAEIAADKKIARQEKTLSRQFVPLKKKREEQKSSTFKLKKTG